MAEKLMRLTPQAPKFGPLPRDPMERLAHFARLAPSTHNSQPWRFVLERDAVDVFADLSRSLPAADGDRRELYLSVGCALETLLIAADYEGFGSELTYFPLEGDESYVCRVDIRRAGPKRASSAADLLHAVHSRHTNHRPFDPQRALPAPELARLRNAVDGEAVALHILDAPAVQPALEALLRRAEKRLLADPGYREELGRWIGAGALGTHWLLSKLGQLAIYSLPVGERLARTEAAWLASAPHVALLSTVDDSRLSQVRAGQAYARIALMAESHAIRNQPISPVLELAPTRAAVGTVFGVGARRPQHLFRLGYGEPERVRTTRRPLAEVMLRGAA